MRRIRREPQYARVEERQSLSWQWRTDVRMFVDELAAVVDLVVDNHVDVVLAGVLGDIRIGEFFLGHVCSFLWYA